MEFMRALPDKHYDLAIVDPPYGTGDISAFTPRAKGTTQNKIHNTVKWNDSTPTVEYWNELFRVSVNQIVWGANYFSEYLPSSRGWVFWDKIYENTMNFSAGELAFTSFNKRLLMVRISQRWIPNTPLNIHPTQKPVALYKWLLQNYAKPGQTIFDSHVGSGSIRIACHDLGFDFEGCEIDADYWKAQEQRFQTHAAQVQLFEPAELTAQYAQGDLL